MKDIRDRIYSAVIEAIENVETTNNDEIAVKLEYLINVGKILGNYEQLRPTLMKYFSEEVERKKLEIRVDETLNNSQKREQLKALKGLALAEENIKIKSEEAWEK